LLFTLNFTVDKEVIKPELVCINLKTMETLGLITIMVSTSLCERRQGAVTCKMIIYSWIEGETSSLYAMDQNPNM
jgi:hypothetical protein